MSDVQEQRRFSRIAFDAPATVTQHAHEWQTRVIDLSLKGVLVKALEDHEVTADTEATVTVQLDGSTGIIMQCRMAHSEPGRCGFHCEHIDLDSITHLRRLVELNLGDEELLERELSRLG